MSSALGVSAYDADCSTLAADDGDVVLLRELVGFEDLDACAEMDCWTEVLNSVVLWVTGGLGFEMMRPDVQCTGACALG